MHAQWQCIQASRYAAVGVVVGGDPNQSIATIRLARKESFSLLSIPWVVSLQDHGEGQLTVVIAAVKPTITDWQIQQDIIGGQIPFELAEPTPPVLPREG